MEIEKLIKHINDKLKFISNEYDNNTKKSEACNWLQFRLNNLYGKIEALEILTGKRYIIIDTHIEESKQ